MIQEHVPVAPLSTLQIGGTARYFAVAHSASEVASIYKELSQKGLPVAVLGGGSNTVFAGDLNCSILKIEIMGMNIVRETDSFVELGIGAGENWDGVVAYAVERNLWGIEAMSAIPGTTGATPVQNVGAYGQEISDVLVEVYAYDTEKDSDTVLSADECKFSYRDSIFKNEAKGRYIITGVLLRLSKTEGTIPDYPGVQKYFAVHANEHPTLMDIRNAIIHIRKNKLPDPSVIPNAGSFFKNPIVSREKAESLKAAFPYMPSFDLEDGNVKIPAGWLMETAGLKGKEFGKIKTYEHNALVLTNTGGATHEDLENAKGEIVKVIAETYGIMLEQEPVVIC